MNTPDNWKLADVTSAIRRHWKSFLLLSVLLSGLIFSLFRREEPAVRYSTLLSVGTFPYDEYTGAQGFIEEPDAAHTRLENQLRAVAKLKLPAELRRPGEFLPVEISHTHLRGVFEITSKGPESERRLHEAMHQTLAQLLIDDHAKRLDQRLYYARMQVKTLDGRIAALAERAKKLHTRAAELEKRLTRSNGDAAAVAISFQRYLLDAEMDRLAEDRQRDIETRQRYEAQLAAVVPTSIIKPFAEVGIVRVQPKAQVVLSLALGMLLAGLLLLAMNLLRDLAGQIREPKLNEA